MALRILAQNVLTGSTATVGYGSVVAGYPASNALTARRSEVSRSNSAFVSGSRWQVDLNFARGSTAPVNAVAICRTNLAVADFAAIALFNGASNVYNASLTSPLFGDSTLDLLSDDSSRSINNFSFWLPSTYSADVVIANLITTSSGVSRVAEIGRIFAGVYKELALNFDWGNTVEWVDPGSSVPTYGGDLIATYGGPPRRKITLPFSGIPEADRAYLYDLMRAVGTSGELFISLWPGAGGRLERDHQMWCRLANTDALRQSHVDFYGASITFIEC
jgi:hypothetical protein